MVQFSKEYWRLKMCDCHSVFNNCSRCIFMPCYAQLQNDRDVMVCNFLNQCLSNTCVCKLLLGSVGCFGHIFHNVIQFVYSPTGHLKKHISCIARFFSFVTVAR